MTAVYASTSPRWFSALSELTPRPSRVAFWRPTYKVPTDIEVGEPWFFKEWGAPRMLGFGRFLGHEGMTLSGLWERYGQATGAASADALLEEIASARKGKVTSGDTEIGNVILSEFTPFPQPIPFTGLELPRLNGAFQYVPAGNPILRFAKPPTAALEFDFAAAAAEVERGGGFDPTSITDARRKVLASIVRRQGQTKFRNELMEAYEGRCAISNCAIPELLEAAHIHPYKGAETNDVRNGILLRTDLHTLFDLGLLAIDTGSWAVLISPRLLGSNYEQFSRRKLRRPRDEAQHPSVEALIQRRTEAGL